MLNFSFFSDAYAQTASGQPGPQILGFLPIIFIFIALYFLTIRPQAKRAKQHKTLIEGLKKGDEVLAAGGILGRISNVGESYLTLEIGQNPADAKSVCVEIYVQKASVQLLLPNGTIHALKQR